MDRNRERTEETEQGKKKKAREEKKEGEKKEGRKCMWKPLFKGNLES